MKEFSHEKRVKVIYVRKRKALDVVFLQLESN